MAAVTGVITAVAGLGLTAYKMYQSNEDKKAADKAADKADAALRNVSEKDEMASLQAPDISKLQYEKNAAQQAMNVEALQGMGAEGAGQIAKMEQVARENNLRTAEDQAQLNYNTDAAKAGNRQSIETRRAQREAGIEWEALQGAQKASAAAKSENRAAQGELVEGFGNLAGEIGDLSNKTKGSSESGFSAEEQAQARKWADDNDKTIDQAFRAFQ